MKMAAKLVALTVSMMFLVGCESMNMSQPDPRIAESNQRDSDLLVNRYHNIHYQNRGFYPNSNYKNGNFYSQRGYRY